MHILDASQLIRNSMQSFWPFLHTWVSVGIIWAFYHFGKCGEKCTSVRKYWC